jgi:hypothetical protein
VTKIYILAMSESQNDQESSGGMSGSAPADATGGAPTIAGQAADAAGKSAAVAGQAAATAGQAADAAGKSADTAEGHSKAAETAMKTAQDAATQAEPNWIYGMVIGFLGAALLALVIAMVIASLSGKRTISADVVSATTLILGGLIGVLAPTPASKKKPKP